MKRFRAKTYHHYHKPDTSAVQNGKEKTAARILHSSQINTAIQTLEVTAIQHYNQ